MHCACCCCSYMVLLSSWPLTPVILTSPLNPWCRFEAPIKYLMMSLPEATSSNTFRLGDLLKLDLQVNWELEFRAKWNLYVSLSGLSTESPDKQVQAFMLCFSCETLTIVENLSLTMEQPKDGPIVSKSSPSKRLLLRPHRPITHKVEATVKSMKKLIALPWNGC